MSPPTKSDGRDRGGASLVEQSGGGPPESAGPSTADDQPRQSTSSVPPSLRRSRHPPKSNPPTLWIAGALLVAGAAMLLVTQGRGLVARFDSQSDTVESASSGRAPSPVELAGELRSQAFAACDAQLWSACGDKLDRARQLDPAGESNARVTAARQAVTRAVARPAAPKAPSDPP